MQDIYQKAMINQNGLNATHLSKEEKSTIKESQDEFKRRGFFKRIFPNINFLYYRQFFEEER